MEPMSNIIVYFTDGSWIDIPRVTKVEYDENFMNVETDGLLNYSINMNEVKYLTEAIDDSV